MELCQPPRAVIAKPKLRVPPLSCDCHASEFGPGLKVLVDLTRELVAHYKLFV